MIRFEAATIRNGSFALTADFEVAPRAVTAVLGASGSGKSTLLMGVAGFLPVEGAITLDTARIEALPPARRPVSILFQDHNLFAHLTVAQNVGLGLRPDLRLGRAERVRVLDSLAQVGLGGLDDRRPEALSGGQRQRVALARALLRDRSVLLLDEPFAALGPGLRMDMLALVSELTAARGLTTLMVTHAPEDAQRIAAHAIVVSEGRALPPQPTAKLLNAPPADLAAYLGRDR